MAFQPFGYHFNVRSPLPPSKAKEAIRARKKTWFASASGPRGWILGPLICLWSSALDRDGPMLFGWIASDGFGTKVSGRAGSDLNGLAMYVLLVPALAFLLFQMVSDRSATTNQILLIGGLIIATPLMLWWGHKDRRAAEPLVYFVRRTIESPGAAARQADSASSMKLIVSGQDMGIATTSAVVRDALCSMTPGDSLVLESASEIYMQTALNDDGFVLEKREGGASRHYSGLKEDDGSDGYLSADEVADALEAYLLQRPEPHWLKWQKMDLG